MRQSHEIVISARDAEALSLMLGDLPRRRRLQDDVADALVDTLVGAHVVAAHQLPTDVVTMGSTVTYAGVPEGARQTVTIVFPAQADASAGRVSVLSPIGRGLLGRARGDVIDIVLPTGRSLAVRIEEVIANQEEREE